MSLSDWYNRMVLIRFMPLFLVTILISTCALPMTGSSDTQVEITDQSDQTPTMTPFQPLMSPAGTTIPSLVPVTPMPSEKEGVEEYSNDKIFWQPAYIPSMVGARLESLTGYHPTSSPDHAAVHISVGSGQLFGEWIYALVAPYPALYDGVAGEEIKKLWLGHPSASLPAKTILMNVSTYGILTAQWGEAAKDAVRVVPDGELVEIAWAERPSLAIIPFEEIEPRWKVLEVDGQSPLRHDFRPDQYALTIPFSLDGERGAVQALMRSLRSTSPRSGEILLTNRSPDRLVVVALTGVTALVRATAYTMRQKGITYPAQDIGALLRSADITHISNEIPFTPDCPPPNPTQEDLRFCSDPAYIALLDEVGTDIVELTGDHFGDWGPEAMRFTLGLYAARGWPYYGGGYDREDARQARLLEINGNRLAFIGCNAKGGGYATASAGQPGAVACDFEWMEKEINRLTKAGYQVIATFQHFEYYTYAPQPAQVRDFRRLAEAGAAVVSGSQAHQPQAMEFFNGSFIHYGLGNLFFDQYHYCSDYACDDAFIDFHTFYEGRYLGNELITIIFEDYARPRLMSLQEREDFLAKLFSASGW